MQKGLFRHFFLFSSLIFISACGGGSGGSSSLPQGPETPTSSTPDSYASGTPAPPIVDADEDAIDVSTAGEPLTLALSDGSVATVPQMDAGYTALIERASTDTALIKDVTTPTGWVPSGTMRQFIVTGDGDPSDMKPVFTIPAAEAGTINLDTVNVMRIGDVVIDGEMVEDQVNMLPVEVDEKGNLTFVDPLMRDGMFQLSTVQNATLKQAVVMKSRGINVYRSSAQDYQWIGGARYVLMSFQDDLNWSREPKLVRMIPEEGNPAGGYRRPATENELVALGKQPICNIILLVHGHNEEERSGVYEASADVPWLFSYKRRVWESLYHEMFLEDNDVPVYPYPCTAFYEYIFPTYRPIFSPVSSKTGLTRETLGQALGRLWKEESENNTQLKAMLENDMPFNVIVVAHSQGGLVARSGFRHMPEAFRSHIKQFITWASPHHGAALYTLRYALQAGYDMVVDGKRIPLQSIRNSEISGPVLVDKLNSHVALDTPGIRDLRWDADKKSLLNLSGVFPDINDGNIDQIQPSLFSTNLAQFNATVSSELGSLSRPYTFMTGNTSKTAELELVDVNAGWWFQYETQQAYRFAESSAIEQGAALNKLMMTAGHASSDGAVPLYSQQAAGIWGPDIDPQGDIDHEEFYGSEPPLRNSASLYKAELIAKRSFDKAELTHESRSCPTLVANLDVSTDKVMVNGDVTFPLYDTENEILGTRIDHFEVRSGGQAGERVDDFTFNYSNSGTFTGQAKTTAIPIGPLAIVAVLKDASEISETLDYQGALPYSWDRAIISDSHDWTITESRDGRVVANLETTDSGGTLSCNLAIDWTLPATPTSPIVMSISRQLTRDATLDNSNFFLKYLSYSGPLMATDVGDYVYRTADVADPDTTWTKSDAGFVRRLNYLPETEGRSDIYYDRTPSIYLEMSFLCGSSERTMINLNYKN